MTILDQIFFASWFFLPAGLANMFPIFAAHAPILKRWEYPMDFSLTFRGRPVLGSNKTIRGLLVAVFTGIATVLVQKIIYSQWPYLQMSPVDYDLVNPLILGSLLGLGAILGDAVKSFIKRQMDIAPGQSFLFFDQLDYIFGGILFSYFYLPLEPIYYFYIIAIYFFLHLCSSAMGFILGLKKRPI